MNMSDLSNLLGDVYGHQSSPDSPPVRREPPAAERAPEWASDSQLDRAFADWEPEARYPLTPEPAAAGPADDHLVAALSAALADTAGPAPAAAPRPAPAAPAAYSAPAPAYAPPAAPPAYAPAPAPAPAPYAAPAAYTPAPATYVPAPAVVAAPGVATRAWTPGDDDIFPKGRGAKKAKNKKR